MQAVQAVTSWVAHLPAVQASTAGLGRPRIWPCVLRRHATCSASELQASAENCHSPSAQQRVGAARLPVPSSFYAQVYAQYEQSHPIGSLLACTRLVQLQTACLLHVLR
jgi:hypothetical protein